MRLIYLQLILGMMIATGIAVPLEDLLSVHLAPERTYSPDATCGNGYSCNPKIPLGGRCCAEDNTCGMSQANALLIIEVFWKEVDGHKSRKLV